MFELQLFDTGTGEYVPVETGESPYDLMDMAKGMARRVLSTIRGTGLEPRFGKCYGKELPLKPRVPYGCSGKPRKYKRDTMIEPTDINKLACRAEAYYRKRAETEALPITVYVWQGTPFQWALRDKLAKYQPKDNERVFMFVTLDPDKYL